jgi:ParB family transcriptional regulator, chromosome partitioning protein
MARKNLLANASGKKLTAVNSQSEPDTRPDELTAVNSPPLPTSQHRTRPPAFASRGALGAVTRSIDELAARADAARDIEARLTAGAIVIDLDPALIDVSFVADRMTREDDPAFDHLLEAIQARGQDSPILVRPNPNTRGRYQVAFGHRRLRVAKALARQVRAVVKQMTDRELVLAQGQENSVRADLSFIERALFARRLEDDGYDRETIIMALNADKTTISRMISAATKIPTPLIEAIGPAPSIGRDRWIELMRASELNGASPEIDKLLLSNAFLAATSDERFNIVLTHMLQCAATDRTDHSGPPNHTRANAQYWANQTGQRLVRVTASERALTLAIDKRLAPGFGDYLLQQMDALYASYVHQKKET